MSLKNSNRKRKWLPVRYVNDTRKKDALYEMQLQIYDVFKSQNPELLDTIFEIEGKKLYADKLRLSAVSSTLNSVLARWTSKNEAVKINDYKFEDFEQFLVYIYSGDCALTDENIFVMLDIAEFYQVNQLKKLCDKFLSNKEYTFENVFQLLELSIKYSELVTMKESLHIFITKNFTSLVKCDEFLKANKFAIEGFLILQPILKHDEVFQAVYEWAENQCILKQEELFAENFNKNDAIKADVTKFLPYFDFKKMDLNFFVQYVVKRGFLFSYDELSDIWECVHSNVKVQIINSNGESLCGILPGDSDAVKVIKSLKNRQSEDTPEIYIKHRFRTIYWKTECKIPSTPAQLKQRDYVSWYLIYLSDGKIAVSYKRDVCEKDYLIAEMAPIGDKHFSGTSGCKIDIV